MTVSTTTPAPAAPFAIPGAAHAGASASPGPGRAAAGAEGTRRHRGLFTIPVTPFTDAGLLDVDSLRRVIAFCVEAGAHGVVSPVNVSEFTTLSPDERHTVFRTIVGELERTGARGRVPFVAGVGAPTTEEAVRQALRATEAGADAVIAMPAFGAPLDVHGCYEFYAALARAARVPVYVQNHEPVGAVSELRPGTPMEPELLARMLCEIEGVRYVKEESTNTGAKIVRTLALAGEHCWGIMGGKAGRFLPDEFRRGACGTMPACEVTDVHAQIWNALDAGSEGTARLILRTVLPLLDLEEAIGVSVCKEVLYRRGLIASPFQRLRGAALDRYDHEELDVLLEEVAPLFTVKTPLRRRA